MRLTITLLYRKVLVHTTKDDEEPESSLLNKLSLEVAEQMVAMKSGQ